MYFRTKTIKSTSLVQLVESYRNAEQNRVYEILGIDWKRSCPTVKSEIKTPSIL